MSEVYTDALSAAWTLRSWDIRVKIKTDDRYKEEDAANRSMTTESRVETVR